MLGTLIVPLDGSDSAASALPYAIRFAQSGNGRLVLVRAALTPPPVTLDGSNWQQRQADAIAEAEAYLQETAQTISNQVSVDTFAPYGHAADVILSAAVRFNADGIVMATHGRTGLEHLLLGSVTEAVVARSMLPVFVVHARPSDEAAKPFAPYTARILVPQDGSDSDTVALGTAVEILGLQGDIVLVTVIQPPEDVLRDDSGRILSYIDQQEEGLRAMAHAYLSHVARPLRERPVPIEVREDIRVGQPAACIAVATLENEADLIVMATHGRTGIQRALVGSVAGTVVRTSPTPVVLVHTPEAAISSAAEPALHAM